jgi:23S rRNA pseudouridine2605 synthase
MTNSKPKTSKGERLQVVLARFGLASRRGVVELIEKGSVCVNGAVIREKGFRVDTASDKISVEGEALAVKIPLEKRYFILNKPKGVMTTLQDPHAEKTVADFFKEISVRLCPVGRLDRDTTGLLLMTNDGELAFRLSHPRFEVKKKYRARVAGFVTDKQLKILEEGVELEEGKSAPCQVEAEERTPKESTIFVTLHEGKKRQIRRVFDKIGHRVFELERLNYGPLSLGDLRFGQKRELTPHEVQSLQKAVGLS